MPANETSNSRVRKTVNDLVMAEMFILQATIESANVIGEGVNELGKQIAANDDKFSEKRGKLSHTLARIADDAVEPYTTRFKYFRKMLGNA